MKKLIHFFILLILFNNSSYSKDLLSLGLEVNSFSQLKEKRTIFFKNSKFFNPEKDFNDKDINDKTINTNYISNEPNIVYQFCCDSNSSASAIFVSKLNDASNKLTNLSDKQVLELDNTFQPIKLAVFKKTKLDKFVYITDNNELIFISRDDKSQGFQYLISKKIIQKKYSLRSLENDFFNSPKFKQKPWNVGVTTLSKDSISISTPNFTVIQSVSAEDLGVIVEKKSGTGNRKVVIANKNFKKVFYYGMWDGKRDLDQADQFLKKPVLNIMPPVYSNMFKSGKTIISEKKPNYNFQDINNAIKKIETLNQKLLSDIKNKEEKFNQIVNAKLEEEKKKQEQLKQKKADEEFQRYQAEQKRIAAEREARLEKQRQEQEALKQEALAAKRMEYVKYGAYILVAILALIAVIYFKIFDVLTKVLKNIFAKKKRFSYLDVDQKGKGKGKKNKNKTLGYWLADWANSYDDPKRAAFNLTLISVAAISLSWWFFSLAGKSGNKDVEGWFSFVALITTGVGGYYIYKIWNGIIEYHCPKCKRIYAGEVYSSTHIGSQQRAKTYRVKDNRTIKYGKYNTKTHNYTVERDETGVEQIDTYHLKAKCKLCSHKWEYNSSTATRVR